MIYKYIKNRQNNQKEQRQIKAIEVLTQKGFYLPDSYLKLYKSRKKSFLSSLMKGIREFCQALSSETTYSRINTTYSSTKFSSTVQNNFHHNMNYFSDISDSCSSNSDCSSSSNFDC